MRGWGSSQERLRISQVSVGYEYFYGEQDALGQYLMIFNKKILTLRMYIYIFILFGYVTTLCYPLITGSFFSTKLYTIPENYQENYIQYFRAIHNAGMLAVFPYLFVPMDLKINSSYTCGPQWGPDIRNT